MSSEQEVDMSRTVVQAYVPAYQRAEWDEHAEDLGMSRSEFVRTMVQAGRRGYGGDPVAPQQTDDSNSSEDGAAAAAESGIRDRIVDALEEETALSWDELREAVAGDIEQQIEDALSDLQDAGRVRHSGRKGGYVLEGNDE